MINVNKVYLPERELYNKYLDKIWESRWVTNRGPLLVELEKKINHYLHTPHSQVVSNGTIAIQLALRALEIKGEVITTPYSYVATTGALLWENCEPVFCDINLSNYCIDAELIEAQITPKTSAILATHVYGLPCDVEKIEAVARKHNLKVIYDGAHAFGCVYKGKSLLSYGDVSTCSFHGTKIFHTIEGGLVTTRDKALDEKIFLLKSFGHIGDEHFSLGINGKNSEFHAAMGLCLIDFMDENMRKRKELHSTYKNHLASLPISYPEIQKDFQYNYGYFPVFFESEGVMLKVKSLLEKNGVNTRRYFYPSLNTLPYLKKKASCKNSESAAARAMCVPFYYDLTLGEVEYICGVIKSFFAEKAHA
jgi:dTDP-4-amino-4,6-dideoxygalactose transaminase